MEVEREARMGVIISEVVRGREVRVKEQKVDPIVTLQKRDPSQPGYGGTLVCPCEAMVKGENSKTQARAWSH